MNPWDRIKHELEAKLSPESYQNWIGRTFFARLEGSTLSVTAPDESTKRWLESEYAGQVVLIARQLSLGIERVEYELANTSQNHSQASRMPEPGDLEPPP